MHKSGPKSVSQGERSHFHGFLAPLFPCPTYITDLCLALKRWGSHRMYGKASSLQLCAPFQVQGTHPGRATPCCTTRCGPGLASGKTVACGQGNHEANAWKRRDSWVVRDISHTLHKWGQAILFAIHTIPEGDTLGYFGFFLSFVTDSRYKHHWGMIL